MPTPFAPLLNDLLVNLPSEAQTAGSNVVFNTNQTTYAALDINITAFTGGTAPTVVFALDRLGADGVYYNIWSLSVGSPISFTFDLGPGFAFAPGINGTQHAVFTTQARFRWSFTGSPTSVTFAASILGR
jgi:hypothetical protein